MAATLRFLQFLSLGTWIGSIVYMSFVIAPGAFSILPSRDLAGAMVNYSLASLHTIGIVAGVIYLLARAASEKSLAALAEPAALLVLLMIVLTMVSQFGVSPRMAALRVQMGSVDATAAESPLRVAFNRLHQVSVWLESAVLLSGLVALFLTARQKFS